MSLSLDDFSDNESGIHRMDPRLKILGFVFFLGAVAFIHSLSAALASLCAAWFWVIYARLPIASVLRRIRVAALFLCTFFLILPLSHPDGSRAGTLQASVILLKGTAMLLVIFPMFGTSPFDLSMKAMEKLKVSSKLITLIFFTYRYFSAYSDQLQALRNHLRARGFKARSDLSTLRTLGHLVGSLLVRSFDQTERVYQAMLCRGYRDRFITLHEFGPLQRSDGYKFGLIILMSAALIFIDQIAGGAPL